MKKFLYLTGASPYNNEANNFNLLVLTTEKIISSENIFWKKTVLNNLKEREK